MNITGEKLCFHFTIIALRPRAALAGETFYKLVIKAASYDSDMF